MAELPNKPTKIPASEVLQYTVEPDGAGGFRLKSNAELSGSIEVDLDAQSGDNIAIADSTTGNKAEVVGNKLQVQDTGAKQVLRPTIDYDTRLMVLSVGDTVQTFTYKKLGSTVATYTVTWTDNTRKVLVSEVWS